MSIVIKLYQLDIEHFWPTAIILMGTGHANWPDVNELSKRGRFSFIESFGMARDFFSYKPHKHTEVIYRCTLSYFSECLMPLKLGSQVLGQDRGGFRLQQGYLTDLNRNLWTDKKISQLTTFWKLTGVPKVLQASRPQLFSQLSGFHTMCSIRFMECNCCNNLI